MGRDKGRLLLNGVTFAEHCRQRFEVIGKWCAVGPFGANCPPEFSAASWLTDTVGGRGPVEGLSVGLAWASDVAEWAFVSTIDVPLVNVDLAKAMIGKALLTTQIVMPNFGGHRYGLTAVYRTRIADEMRRLVEEGFRKVTDLPERFETVFVDEACVREIDPTMQSFSRINDPAEYERFLHEFDSRSM